MLASVYHNSSLFQHRVFPVSHTNVEAPPPNEAQRGNHHVRANGESCNVRGETSQAADVRAIGWLEEKSQRTLWEERSLLLARCRSVSFEDVSHLFFCLIRLVRVPMIYISFTRCVRDTCALQGCLERTKRYKWRLVGQSISTESRLSKMEISRVRSWHSNILGINLRQ